MRSAIFYKDEVDKSELQSISCSNGAKTITRDNNLPDVKLSDNKDDYKIACDFYDAKDFKSAFDYAYNICMHLLTTSDSLTMDLFADIDYMNLSTDNSRSTTFGLTKILEQSYGPSDLSPSDHEVNSMLGLREHGSINGFIATPNKGVNALGGSISTKPLSRLRTPYTLKNRSHKEIIDHNSRNKENIDDPSVHKENVNYDIHKDQSQSTYKIQTQSTHRIQCHSTYRIQCLLAYLYKNGKGCKKDEIKSLFWMKRAVDHGSLVAAYNLALEYRGKNQLSQALKYCEIFANKNNIHAIKLMSSINIEMKNFCDGYMWMDKLIDITDDLCTNIFSLNLKDVNNIGHDLKDVNGKRNRKDHNNIGHDLKDVNGKRNRKDRKYKNHKHDLKSTSEHKNILTISTDYKHNLIGASTDLHTILTNFSFSKNMSQRHYSLNGFLDIKISDLISNPFNIEDILEKSSGNEKENKFKYTTINKNHRNKSKNDNADGDYKISTSASDYKTSTSASDYKTSTSASDYKTSTSADSDDGQKNEKIKTMKTMRCLVNGLFQNIYDKIKIKCKKCNNIHRFCNNRAARFLSKTLEFGVGDTNIEYCLGKLLYPGRIDIKYEIGVDEKYKNINECIRLFKPSASAGFSDSQWFLHKCYKKNGEHEESEKWLQIIIDNNIKYDKDKNRQTYIKYAGEELFEIKLRKNRTEAETWCSKYVEEGKEWANFVYGTYLWNKSTSEDKQNGLILLHRAVMKGNEDAIEFFSYNEHPCNGLLSEIKETSAISLDFDIWLYYVDDDDIQMCLREIQYEWDEPSRYYTGDFFVKDFVFKYGLDWRDYYARLPHLRETREYQSVIEQHEQMCNICTQILKLELWPRDIFRLIAFYIPWFYLVARELKI